TCQSAPKVLGVNTSVFIPRPQNQVPKRDGRGAPAARAVPPSLRNRSSSGSETLTAPPPSRPWRTRRRFACLVLISIIQPHHCRRAVEGTGAPPTGLGPIGLLSKGLVFLNTL